MGKKYAILLISVLKNASINKLGTHIIPSKVKVAGKQAPKEHSTQLAKFVRHFSVPNQSQQEEYLLVGGDPIVVRLKCK